MAVVEPVAAYLAGAPPRSRTLIALALAVLERSAFPRRFSALPLASRSRRITRLQEGRFGLGRDLVLLLKAMASFGYTRDSAVQQALGIEPRCAVAPGEPLPPPPAPPLQRGALRPPADGETESVDVVVVGSGASGGALARVLAEAGLDVLVLEAGEYHDASSYTTDPLQALPRLYRDSGFTVAEGRPAIPLPVGRCVGGTTVVNSGTCLRTPADVLERWRAEFGIEWAPELQEEYGGVERDLRVMPVDLELSGRNAQLCHEGAEALGASNGPLPRNAGRVVCCATCPTGCALDAKQSAHVSELARAVVAGARVYAESEVTKVVVQGGRATGVIARTATGHFTVGARAVVLCGGSLGTPELLLRHGLANSSGQVGRNLSIHPACWVGGRFEEEVRGWDGVMQSWHVDEWRDRGVFLEATFTPLPFGAHWLPGAGATFMQRVADFGRVGVVGVMFSDKTSRGRVSLRNGRLRVGYRLSDEDAVGVRFGIARAADIMFAAGAVEVYPQIGGLAVVGPDERDVIERGRFRPADLRLEGFHPMGTARMGADPAAAVVKPSGETHDVRDLWVADASVFPTSLGVNPMITIIATARRIARGLAAELA